MGDSRPLFVYFRIFFTVNKSMPMTRFEPRTSLPQQLTQTSKCLLHCKGRYGKANQTRLFLHYNVFSNFRKPPSLLILDWSGIAYQKIPIHVSVIDVVMNLFLDEIKISQKLNNLDPFLINRETSGQKRLFFPQKSGKIFAKSGQTGHNLQNLRAQSFLPFPSASESVSVFGKHFWTT